MQIICPVCKEFLNKENKTYKCINRHSFDIAKEGYVNLNLKNSQKTGDEKEMVIARREFLKKDYYLFLKEKLNEIIKELNTHSLLDLGCGEGYYTSYFEAHDKTGIDLSKETLKQASRIDKNTVYILSSIFKVPVQDETVDTVLTCFAPVSDKEIVRVLKNKGHFILVRPNEKHLYELKEAVYDDPYLNETDINEIDGLTHIKRTTVNDIKHLNNDALKELFTMTPYYHKTKVKDKEKISYITDLQVTFDFIIDIYIKD